MTCHTWRHWNSWFEFCRHAKIFRFFLWKNLCKSKKMTRQARKDMFVIIDPSNSSFSIFRSLLFCFIVFSKIRRRSILQKIDGNFSTLSRYLLPRTFSTSTILQVSLILRNHQRFSLYFAWRSRYFPDSRQVTNWPLVLASMIRQDQLILLTQQ